MRLSGRKLFYTGVSEDVRVYPIAVSANDAVNCNASADDAVNCNVNCIVSAVVRKHSSEKKLYNKNTAVYNGKNGSGGRKCYAGII